MENATALRTASLLHDCARKLTRSLDRQLAPLEVTAQQAALLINLANGATSPKRLAVALGTDTAGTTRLIDRLEAKNLLRRHRGTTDRRAVVLELTDTGRRLTPSLVPAFGATAADLFGTLADADIRQMGDLLARALTNAEPPHTDGSANG
ncbi:MarR family winged helix-turn-helix transcriptional regulator [Nocardia jinanensis]|uniref:MarR family transcriptional regulator n=1 Tax=Nocardia jinanensis TaxID=382504 RepID=A0A917RX42_9NOCA|nr:MarR family transcriptional regulator [Nocardia jinanensis]GGL41632.1 MarR family transcriptional regulator [Nocardia jinanensis]